MSILKLLSKAYATDVLNLLNERGEMYFGEILNELDIHKSNLSKLLAEIEENGLVSLKEVSENKRMPKKYYKLTKKGLEILNRCNEIEKIQSENE
ncbi:MarR family transcriptional regulator [Methanococcus maripaludis]|jgi:DNA-binding HxlR family transcriptional regulator|nr:MarR family transcriptional regulator [Methanococcus maripaludis]